MKRLKVDGRSKEGRRLKAMRPAAVAEINRLMMLPMPDGIYRTDGTPITAGDALRADFDAVYILGRRKGAVAFTPTEPTKDERAEYIYDTLGGS